MIKRLLVCLFMFPFTTLFGQRAVTVDTFAKTPVNPDDRETVLLLQHYLTQAKEPDQYYINGWSERYSATIAVSWDGKLLEVKFSPTPSKGGMKAEVERLLRQIPQWVKHPDHSSPSSYYYYTFEVTLHGHGTGAKNSEYYLYQDDTVYIKPSQMPEFPGGVDALLGFIKSNLKLAPVKSNDIEGAAYVTFIIDSKGNSKDAHVSRVWRYPEDDYAVEVVNSFPIWKPAINNGKPVSSLYTVPIRQKLQ